MLIIGKFFLPEKGQDWYLNKGLPFAKKIVKKFPVIDSIFSSFKSYENKEYKQRDIRRRIMGTKT